MKKVLFVAVAIAAIAVGCLPEQSDNETECSDTCQYANNGVCDDGGPNSVSQLCDCGTDCADCGERLTIDCNNISSSSSSGGSSSGGSSSSSSSGSSSSSSSSGGGYSASQVVGIWQQTIPDFTAFIFCNDGIFERYEYIPFPEQFVSHFGNWEVNGSILSLCEEGSTVSRDYLILSVPEAPVSNGDSIYLQDFETNEVVGWSLSLAADPCDSTPASTSANCNSGTSSSSSSGSSSGGSSSSSSGGSSSSSSSGGPVACGSTVTDVDGNVYNVVQIGNQCWMKEDLRTTRYRDGSLLEVGVWAQGSQELAWVSENAPGAWTAENDGQFTEGTTTYLYNISATQDIRGLCPNGWRLPDEDDVEELFEYVSGEPYYPNNWDMLAIVSDALKSNSGWCSYDVWNGGTNPPYVCGNGNNSSQFSAYPTGYITSQSAVYDGHNGRWWLVDTYYPNGRRFLNLAAYSWDPYGFDEAATIGGLVDRGAHACRCIKE